MAGRDANGPGQKENPKSFTMIKDGQLFWTGLGKNMTDIYIITVRESVYIQFTIT